MTAQNRKKMYIQRVGPLQKHIRRQSEAELKRLWGLRAAGTKPQIMSCRANIFKHKTYCQMYNNVIPFAHNTHQPVKVMAFSHSDFGHFSVNVPKGSFRPACEFNGKSPMCLCYMPLMINLREHQVRSNIIVFTESDFFSQQAVSRWIWILMNGSSWK